MYKFLYEAQERDKKEAMPLVYKEGTLSPTELENLKNCLAVVKYAACAQKDIAEFESMGSDMMDGDYSGRRGRSSTTGRYMSRGMDGMMNSYDSSYDGNSMRGGNSNRRYYGNEGNSNYSGHSVHDRMIADLEREMDHASSEYDRKVIMEQINKIRQEQQQAMK